MGISAPSDLAALKFVLDQASDFGSIAERGSIGSQGQGWSSLTDIKLLISEDGSKSITGLVNADVLSSLDATQTGQYAVSLSLGKILGQDGKLANVDGFSRPTFGANQNLDGNMTLEEVAGDYQLITANNETFIFDQAGKLTSFVSNIGEVISVMVLCIFTKRPLIKSRRSSKYLGYKLKNGTTGYIGFS